MHPSGSIALKLARVAAGEADATFTLSPRSEWDLAAGHALVRAAGGNLTRRSGEPIFYNQASPHLEQGIVAGQPDAYAWLQAELNRLNVPATRLNVPAQSPLRAGLPAPLGSSPALHVRLGAGLCWPPWLQPKAT
ncbi:inositol monophosphatase family protein [Deinococcus lacus]|uniref:Inositol monophosphatase family protein n=1 Tax=Deinococcus lacus TaxID=392561 RepID=A0ABW1Y966_9DEIO